MTKAAEETPSGPVEKDGSPRFTGSPQIPCSTGKFSEKARLRLERE
jgi:hypothetical protein